MSNGAVCCARLICCPPLKRLQAVAHDIKAWAGGAISGMLATKIAKGLLATHDLAPVGIAQAVKDHWQHDDTTLGAAVRELYQADFDALAAHEAGR